MNTGQCPQKGLFAKNIPKGRTTVGLLDKGSDFGMARFG